MKTICEALTGPESGLVQREHDESLRFAARWQEVLGKCPSTAR
jgi:hypothetical protein